MKKLLVLLFIINFSKQLTRNQFDDIHFHRDYFGKVEKIVYLPDNKICLINKKGLKAIDLKTQEDLYFITQNIEQIQLISNRNLLVKNNNEILQFDTLLGKLIKKTKINAQNIMQFLYVDDEFFFMTKNSIIKQSQSGQIKEQKFESNLNSIMYQSKLQMFMFTIEPNGNVFTVDKELQNFDSTEASLRTFKEEDKFDSGKFILDKNSQQENQKQVLDSVIFNQVESTEQYQIMKTKKGLEVMNASAEEILILSSKDLKEQPQKMFTNGKLFVLQSKLLTLEIFRISDKKKIYQSEESLANIKHIEFFLEHDTREHLSYFLTYQKLQQDKKYLDAWRLRLKLNTMIINENFQSFLSISKKIIMELMSGNLVALKNIFKNTKQQLQSKIAIILTKNGKLFRYSLKTNSLENHMNIYLRDLVLTKEEDRVFSLSLKDTDKKEFYNLQLQNIKSVENKDNKNKNEFKFKVDLSNNTIKGFYNNQDIWQINFQKNEKILKYQTMQDSTIPQNSFIIEKNHVLYKLIDPNNLILVTQTNKGNTAYLINVKYGKILGQYQLQINDKNFELLVDDNSFFIVYYDSFKHATEIVNFEIFRTKIEKELLPIIKTSWQNNNQKLEEIDYNAYDQQYLLMHKTYSINSIVKKVFAFDSVNDLTSKNILLLTKDDKLFSVSRELLSTRRCLAKEKEKALKNIQRINEKKIKRENYYKSQMLPDYEYQIKLQEKDLVSGNLNLKNLDKIYVSPSIYESTSDLIVTGQSFLVIQHSPNQLFDQLPNSFDKLKLIGFLLFLGLAYLALSLWSQKKAKFQNYDTS